VNRVIWCTPGRPEEANWIADLNQRGFTVVRRCVEAVDVLAAASVEAQAAVVIDLDTPRLSADTIAAIPGVGERIVIAIASDDDAADRARHWGVDSIVRWGESGALDRVVTELQRERRSSMESTAGGSPIEASNRSARGLTAVYGPAGAPGRSTIALGLAEAWARSGDRVCLIDADTIGPSLALLVGMTEDVSGLLVAARYADQGALDARSLGSACRRLDDRLWLMSGIGSPERWHQLRPTSIERVVRTCVQLFDRVVVDMNPLLNIGHVEEVVPGGMPLRDSATRSVLQMSDTVFVVTQPDAVSVTRLTVDLPLILALASNPDVSVVVNRCSRRDSRSAARVSEVLIESGISVPVHSIPEDKSVLLCRRTGSLLSEVATTRKLRRSLAQLRHSAAA